MHKPCHVRNPGFGADSNAQRNPSGLPRVWSSLFDRGLARDEELGLAMEREGVSGG